MATPSHTSSTYTKRLVLTLSRMLSFGRARENRIDLCLVSPSNLCETANRKNLTRVKSCPLSLPRNTAQLLTTQSSRKIAPIYLALKWQRVTKRQIRSCLDIPGHPPLKHNNIVPFLGIAYGFGMQDATSLVSSWMPNGTLADLLEKHNSELAGVCRLRLVRGLCPLVAPDLSPVWNDSCWTCQWITLTCFLPPHYSWLEAQTGSTFTPHHSW